MPESGSINLSNPSIKIYRSQYEFQKCVLQIWQFQQFKHLKNLLRFPGSYWKKNWSSRIPNAKSCQNPKTWKSLPFDWTRNLLAVHTRQQAWRFGHFPLQLERLPILDVYWIEYSVARKRPPLWQFANLSKQVSKNIRPLPCLQTLKSEIPRKQFLCFWLNKLAHTEEKKILYTSGNKKTSTQDHKLS